VLILVLVLLLVWFVLSVILAAWTLWFQGYIYSEPAGEVWWRAPAAGTALTLFLVLWVVLDYKSVTPGSGEQAHGRYRELQSFSYSEDLPHYKQLTIINRDGKEQTFELKRTSRGGEEYRSGNTPLPSRPDKIIVTEDGEKVVFEPDRDARGIFKVGPDNLLHFHDNRGREMVEGYLGQVSIRHTSWLLGNFVLNFLHLVVWWLCLWLLLRFQWSHALGLAVVFWGVTTLFVLPLVLDRAEVVARERPPAVAAAPVGAASRAGPSRAARLAAPTLR
jgi:hypothetical protein